MYLAEGARIEFCGACSRARGITEEDMANAGGQPGNPDTFVEDTEWCDKSYCRIKFMSNCRVFIVNTTVHPVKLKCLCCQAGAA